MKCPNCNHEIPDNSKFCTACGSKVELKTVSDLTPDAIPPQPPIDQNSDFATQPDNNTPPQEPTAAIPPIPDTQSSGAGAPPIPPIPPSSQSYQQPQEPQQPRYVTNTKPPKSCKTCGGKIDPMTNRCTNCGKPYSSINGMLIGLIAAGVVALILAVVVVVQGIKLNDAYTAIDDDENTISTLSSQVAEYQEKADFLDTNIVFVLDGDDIYYHTYDCADFQQASSYYAMNTNLAIYYGYIADPYCH
ncbi:MAG: zinc ribbon domain-containing protein [Anaerofustis sp.]